MDTETKSQWTAVDLLRQEYSARQSRNAQYSLRAFARDLKIAPGPLSEILQDKRSLTRRLAIQFANLLFLSAEERQRFIELTSPERLSKRVAPKKKKLNYQSLSEHNFHLISDWHHYALLSLMEIEGFKSDPKWMALRLGIPTSQVRTALIRLKRLGMARLEKGKWNVTGEQFESSDNVPSAALRKFHSQTLTETINTIYKVPVGERDITSVTLAIDPKKLELARKKIRIFRKKLSELLHDGTKTEVYRLNVQLVPITRKGKK